MSTKILNRGGMNNLCSGINRIKGMFNSCEYFEHTNDGKLYGQVLDDFIARLFDGNVKQFKNRYEDRYNKDIINSTVIQDVQYNIFQVLKSLECLHYNSNLSKEDDKILRILMQDIQTIIINDIDDYQNAYRGVL